MKKTLFTFAYISLFMVLGFTNRSFAASVGDTLTKPETGWTRFDARSPELVYSIGWEQLKNSETESDYNKTVLGAKHKERSELRFKFEGSKIRLITNTSYTYSKKIGVTIDGVTEYFSAISETWKHQIVAYEKTGLEYGMHEVVIWSEEPSPNVVTYDYRFDAIDTDGKLIDYNIPDPEPTPEPEPTGDRAILVIIMTTGLEKEYDLSMAEVNSFINWYDTKDAGTGPSKYAIDKHDNNKGPFSKRTDYVIFNNILTFEVNEYSN